MLESLSAVFADISLPELALITAMALVASVVGGVAGYGTGALMPLVLVPIVGAEPVVPILSLSALFTNTSRAAAFWRLVDPRRALIVLVAALPTCVLGAWGLYPAQRQGRGAGDRRHAGGECTAASLDAAARSRALEPRTSRRLLRLGAARGRHRRRRHHPALAVDGGGPRRRRRGRDRCRHLHGHGAGEVRDLRAGGRGERAGDRDCVVHRRGGAARRFPGQGADRAPAVARAHRDPRRGRDRRRRGDDRQCIRALRQRHSRPLHHRRQRGQDRLDIAAGAQPEDGAAVVEQVELHVTAAAHELLLALGRAPGRGQILAHQLGINPPEGVADFLREGKVRLPVRAVEIVVENAADAAHLAAVAQVEVFVAPALVLL